MEFSNLNLQLFTPLMSPWIRALYTLALILGTIVAFHVQKVVLRTLGNLNKRHINIIIYPSLVRYQYHFNYLLQVTKFFYLKVVMDIFGCFFVSITFIRTFCYPMIDVLGSTMCYVYSFTEVYLDIFLNFQTFFTILYRYICLCQSHIMLSWRISPKALAKILLFVMVLSAFSISVFSLSTTETFTLQICIGNYIVTYNQ